MAFPTSQAISQGLYTGYVARGGIKDLACEVTAFRVRGAKMALGYEKSPLCFYSVRNLCPIYTWL